MVEIWFGVVDDRLALISGNGPAADWFRNLQADAAVLIRIGDETRSGRAAVVTDAHLRRSIGDVMGAKYVWSGDASIGLTYDVWCYVVPAAIVSIDEAVGDSEAL